MSKIRGIFSVKGQRSKVKKSESGIQSRETAKKDSDEEAARRDSAEDLTGGVGNCIMALLHKNVREHVEGGS